MKITCWRWLSATTTTLNFRLVSVKLAQVQPPLCVLRFIFHPRWFTLTVRVPELSLKITCFVRAESRNLIWPARSIADEQLMGFLCTFTWSVAAIITCLCWFMNMRLTCQVWCCLLNKRQLLSAGEPTAVRALLICSSGTWSVLKGVFFLAHCVTLNYTGVHTAMCSPSLGLCTYEFLPVLSWEREYLTLKSNRLHSSCCVVNNVYICVCMSR